MRVGKLNQLFVVMVALFVVGCNAGRDQTNIEIFDDHFDQISVKAQDWDQMMVQRMIERIESQESQSGKKLSAEEKSKQLLDLMNKHQVGMRVPPEGTVPKGFKPYKYKFRPDLAEKNIKNPFKGDFSPEMIERGKNRYDIYCAVCHGFQGNGDGPVAEKFLLKPPVLIGDKAKGFSDGKFFHIITAGQGVMGSYSRQIRDHKDRWAVVNYVRVLQKKSK